MHKKLTITLDEAIYKGLHHIIGRRNISRFVALADQLTTVSKQRLSSLIGRLLEEDLHKVERVVRLQLGL
jgi:mRNA-degrading endonuclease toxin of MazEF toxin-antitoxin module